MMGFTFRNKHILIGSLSLFILLFGSLGSNWRINSVSAEEEIEDHYLPPYMLADLLVNVSSAFFDEGRISTQSKDAFIIQQTQENIRFAISSVLNQKDFERGWVMLHMSLSAYEGKATITPTTVIESKISNYAHLDIHGYNIQKLDSYFVVNANYPSALISQDENQTNEKPKIGWDELNEEFNSMQDYYKDNNYIATTNILPFQYNIYENFEEGDIEEPAIFLASNTPTSAEKYSIKDFLVTKSLFQTVFDWITESLGFDISIGEQRNIKSVFGESIKIETVIPYVVKLQKDYSTSGCIEWNGFYTNRMLDEECYSHNVEEIVYSQPDYTTTQSNTAPAVSTYSIMESLRIAIREGRVDKVKSILTDASGQTITDAQVAAVIKSLTPEGQIEETEVNTTISNGILGFLSILEDPEFLNKYGIIIAVGAVVVMLIGVLVIMMVKKRR